MLSQFFDRHTELLNQATAAIHKRGYWSAFAEMPSPKAYGDTANDNGKLAFEAYRNRLFDFGQPGNAGQTGQEASPFGIDLGITYNKSDLNALFPLIHEATRAWRNAGPEAWVGVALESLNRLNKRSFEIAYAVMHTSSKLRDDSCCSTSKPVPSDIRMSISTSCGIVVSISCTLLSTLPAVPASFSSGANCCIKSFMT